MAKYLDKAGLKTTLTALKSRFAALDVVSELTEVVDGLLSTVEALEKKVKDARTDLLKVCGYTETEVMFAKACDGVPTINVTNGDIRNMPPIDLSKCTYFSIRNSPVQIVHNLYLPLLESLSTAFTNCTELQSLPPIYAPNARDMQMTFAGCSKLIRCPDLVLTTDPTGASYISTARQAFKDCPLLIHVPELNLRMATDLNGIFYGCGNLRRIESLKIGPVLADISNWFGIQDNLNPVFLNIEGIGISDSITTWDFHYLRYWGQANDENRRSLVNSLITFSYDRTGNTRQTIRLSAEAKNLLTTAEIAQITAKNYTLA